METAPHWPHHAGYHIFTLPPKKLGHVEAQASCQEPASNGGSWAGNGLEAGGSGGRGSAVGVARVGRRGKKCRAGGRWGRGLPPWLPGLLIPTCAPTTAHTTSHPAQSRPAQPRPATTPAAQTHSAVAGTCDPHRHPSAACLVTTHLLSHSPLHPPPHQSHHHHQTHHHNTLPATSLSLPLSRNHHVITATPPRHHHTTTPATPISPGR
ncbi:hypothetical protein E2C01_070649 [Portunus trituberculatus]|uniref:Uncharacterized protein n=1 Tax=Portunus trituberculatus TaxID=210409 RepID=A0A5B7HXV2_PORTR|nr:hypothetical protein [Portunus trituberculatus]